MTKPATTLNELIEITRDGQTFYADAIAEVKNPQLAKAFRGIVDAKAHLIGALSEQVRVRGDQPSTDGTFAGGFRKLYADVRAKLSNEKDSTYVAQLEQSEDRLLNAFEDAAKDADDPALARVLEEHLPQVRTCHDQMRDLKVLMARYA
jgi:uncharacterized protein (TIGR02284 family)